MNSNPIRDSELIINDDGSVFHLHLHPEDIADRLLIMGDQDRVTVAARLLDSVELRKQSREFSTVTGMYKGTRVTILSHGIGTDNIDIVMTELDALANIDFHTRTALDGHRRLKILRVGTCGATQSELAPGTYVYTDIALGFDGILNWYSDGEKYMLKDFEEAFVRYMDWPERLAAPYFVKSGRKLAEKLSAWAVPGITVSAPGFYGPQGRSVRMNITIPDLVQRLKSFEFAGRRITNIEMESSALSGMSAVLGHEAGTVCLVVANRFSGNVNPDYKKLMTELLANALDTLIQTD